MTETLLDLTPEELSATLTARFGAPKFAGTQICDWLYKKRVFDPEDMTNLSKALRAALKEGVRLRPISKALRQDSSDGTKKYLWNLDDGDAVESVVMDHGDHLTACISSQAGCPLACAFCATGKTGYRRNLTVGEITAQLLFMEEDLGRPIQNVVFMGMGEPFLNTDAVLKAIGLFTHPKARGMGGRHITISTSGLPDGIDALANSPFPNTRLCLSLHAPNDELRTRLMPVNRRYPLAKVVDALRRWQEKTGVRLTIEYLLIKNITDGPELAYELVTLLDGLKYYVNLIPYNPAVPGFSRPSASRIRPFAAALRALGVETEIRKEKGTDINAACGQLRANKA